MAARARGLRLAARSMPLLAGCLLLVGVIVGACGGERERLSQELAERLAAAGVEAFDVSVWPPHGMVPHTNVELRVEGDEAAARTACAKVEELARYDDEPPYLVRVAYGPGRVFECGWGVEGRPSGGASPGAPNPRPTIFPTGGPSASPSS